MKKLLIFPILGIALLISPTFAQYESCQDCLDNSEGYLACVGSAGEMESCEGSFMAGSENCTQGRDFCEQACFDIEDESEREECMSSCDSSSSECEDSLTSEYNSCVAGCQTNYCGVGICTSAGGGSEGGNGGSPIAGGVLNGTQLSNMGTALTNGGSSLLKIGIQLMPYMIAFTIILLIFTLIRNWSKLKSNKGLGDSSHKLPGVFHDDDSEDVDPYTLVDALNFYVDDEKKYYPKNSSYKHGKYFFDRKRGDIGYYYWFEGKKYTEYEDPRASYVDTLSDKEHHYKKRHGLYKD